MKNVVLHRLTCPPKLPSMKHQPHPKARPKMHILSRALLLSSIVVGTGCQSVSVPPPAKAAAVILHLDPKTLTFRPPGSGCVCSLHLGGRLNEDTGGITEVPKNIKDNGVRDATTSYYKLQDKGGATYATAESSYTRDGPGLVEDTRIQYQPDTGRLLITENTSDGRPCVRYILYSPSRRGYQATYLMPGFTDISGGRPTGAPIAEVPSEVRLLPGARAEINGKKVRVDAIVQSTPPFSVSN